MAAWLAALARFAAGSSARAAAPAASRVGASTAARSAAQRTVAERGSMSPKGGAVPRGISRGAYESARRQVARETFGRNLRSAASAAFRSSWDILNWTQILESMTPSVTDSVDVTVIGRKGTPSKFVLHTALAAAFGTMARNRPKLGSLVLAVSVDHMNNAVQVKYMIQVGMKGAGASKLIADAKIDSSSTKPINSKLKQVHVNNGTLMRPDNGSEPPTVTDGMAAPGSQRDKGPAETPAPAKDKIEELFSSYYNLYFADAIWADPKSAEQATAIGYLGKEVIQAGLPPTILVRDRRHREPFPEPYRSMIEPLLPTLTDSPALGSGAEIVTRFPIVAGGAPALNPLPPVPRNQNVIWPYGEPAPTVPRSDPTWGYAFDLRTLVAQALIDPGVDPPGPQTDVRLAL